jgi:hypothetical protein
MDEQGPIRVYASGDAVSGELMRGRLEAEGIAVMVKGEAEGPYRMGGVQLWVAPEDEARAKAVIEAVESGAYALDASEDPEDETISASSTEEPSGPS